MMGGWLSTCDVAVVSVVRGKPDVSFLASVCAETVVAAMNVAMSM